MPMHPTTRRAFIGAGLLAIAAGAGGCAFGGGNKPGPEVDFTIQNLSGSTAVVRFDLGIQSSTETGLIERVRGAEVQIERGKTLWHSPDRGNRSDLRRRVRESSGALVWQVEVRVLGSSWEEPIVNWFELRESGPTKLSLHGGISDQTGEQTIHLRADGQFVSPIPNEHWPVANSN